MYLLMGKKKGKRKSATNSEQLGGLCWQDSHCVLVAISNELYLVGTASKGNNLHYLFKKRKEERPTLNFTFG